jgi:NADH:ubiquinone oxidoreductase subunit E
MRSSEQPVEITICMGSSCFARGNGENLIALQNFLRQNQLAAELRLRGQLCREKCTLGPNIVINGREHTNVQPGTVVWLLEQALREGQSA